MPGGLNRPDLKIQALTVPGPIAEMRQKDSDSRISVGEGDKRRRQAVWTTTMRHYRRMDVLKNRNSFRPYSAME